MESVCNPSPFIEGTVSYREICKFCALVGRAKSEEDEDMILCDKCSVWLHFSCIGIASVHFDKEDPFYCCAPPDNEELNFLLDFFITTH